MGAGNPTLPAISNADATALQNTVHDGTGTRHKTHGRTPEDDPTHATELTMWEHRIAGLVAGANQGMVIDLDAGRAVGAFALHYKRGGTLYSFPGETSLTLDASDDHYIYLDDDEVLEVNHVAFPADSYHLAFVVTNADDITTLEDRRWENADVGGTNAWSVVAATQDVDMDDNSLNDVEGIDFTPDTELTIDAGSITPTQFYHTVDTEGEAGADFLTAIVATPGKLQLLLLRPEDHTRVVTIMDGANLTLLDDDYVMDQADCMILFIQVDDTDWVELARNRNAPSALLQHLDCNGYDLEDVGALKFGVPDTKQIAAGEVTVEETNTRLTPQTGLTDDLDTIVGGSDGMLLILSPSAVNYIITVKHGTGNIELTNGADCVLDGAQYDKLVLIAHEALGGWMELARTQRSIEDLIDTARSILYPIEFSIPGALAAGAQEEWHRYCKHEIVIVDATGYVDGTPGGGTCIVDILDNGVSIFANEGEMIVIADGANQDTSAVKNHVVAAGHRLSCEIKNTAGSPNGADDLTVSIDARAAPKNEP